MAGTTYNFSEQFWLSIFDSIYDGICIYDGKGNPVYANEAHMKNLGFEEGEFWQYNIYDIYHLDPPIVSQPVTPKTIKRREPTTGTVTYYRTGKTCMVSAYPATLSNGEVLIVSTIHDMTELLKLQDLLEESASIQETYRVRLSQLENPVLVRTKSKTMSDIFEKAGRISTTLAPILLLGETGVGKDFLASYIHEHSNLSGTFVKVNCGAIPDNLMESELFGYVQGAFTGANKGGKAGLIESADNGTLFLDEIADLPLSLQVKLLGVLQDRQITRLGATSARPVNFRVIAATNADLTKRIANGTFRSDLYYRLNVVNFHIPPLRERPEDILPLSTFFLAQLNEQYNKRAFFDPYAIRALTTYPWPGNIRELKNTLERVVVLLNDSRITKEIVEQNLLYHGSAVPDTSQDNARSVSQTGPLKKSVARYEQELINSAILKHGTLAAAAAALEVDVSTLVRKKRRKIK